MSSAESPKPNYVLVRHMARSPLTRTTRAARSGHRRQGVLLDDGTRIRRKGKRRLTQIDLREFIGNHARLLEYVRVGTLEVLDPVSERGLSYDDLIERLDLVGLLKKAESAQPAAAESEPAKPESSDEGYTKDELMSMVRPELNRVAKHIYGVKSPEKLPNKEEVVKAIFAAAGEE